MMVKTLAQYWWLLALRGFVAVLFGILAFIWPTLTVEVLVLLFGAYVLVDGVASLLTAVTNRHTNNRWWVLLLEGLAGVAAGVLTFIWPGITAVILLYIIAAWAIWTGIFEIIAAIRLREEIEGEWVLALSGIASLMLGVALVIWPGAGLIALTWMIGAYAILFGVLTIFLAFKVKGWQQPFTMRQA